MILISPTLDRVTGVLLVVLTGVVIAQEWHLLGPAPALLAPLVLALTALLTLQVAPGRRAFVAVAGVLTLALVWRDPEGWRAVVARAVASAAFIVAFFSALASLRSAAQQAAAIRAGGTFLALQPPGRRYLALTLGGQAFALLLNYGAIALLGSLATAAARDEPDAEIRAHRTRRMLLAIQRGFVASLPWSPMSFAVAISTALIPGTSWGTMLLPGLATMVLLTGVGWGLDTLFKPKLSRPPAPRIPPEGSWALLLPLALLLGLLVLSVLVLQLATGFRVTGIVMLVVPLMALGWVALQQREGGPSLPRRVREFVCADLPSFRGEITLLMMAGYIGTVGAPLLAPLIQSSPFHPEDLPTPLVLAGLVWLVPLCGQIGMNPILTVSLIAPSVPSAEMLGVPPVAIVTAITAGWALGGISSPFTATTLLVGNFGGVSARHVGLRWNGSYMAGMLVLLPLWVLLLAWLAG